MNLILSVFLYYQINIIKFLEVQTLYTFITNHNPMRNIYQVADFFTTLINSLVTFTPALAGTTTIPVAAQPSIADGKFFHIIIKPTDTINRMVLRCFMQGGVMKCNNSDIPISKTYDQDVQVAIFDIASLFNTCYQQIEDFGNVEKLNSGGLYVNVFGGRINDPIGIDVSVNDVQLLLVDNTTNYVYYDKLNMVFASALTEPPTQYVCAKVITS